MLAADIGQRKKLLWADKSKTEVLGSQSRPQSQTRALSTLPTSNKRGGGNVMA